MATDAEIRAKGFLYIPKQKYLQKPFNLPVAPVPPPASGGITNTNAFNNSGGSGGSGGGALQVGDPMLNFDNYYNYTGNKYMQNQDTPNVDDLYQSKLDKTFMGFPSYKQQDPIGPFTPYSQPMDMDDPAASIENIIASRNLPLEQTKAGKIQSRVQNMGKGIKNLMGMLPTPGNFLSKLGSFNSLSPADQLFIKTNTGYTGPTVFGENSMGNKDPFGMNVESAFGNYAEGVRDNFSQLQDTLTNKDRGAVTFNEVTGMFEGEDADEVNKKTTMIRKKFLFRKKQIDQQNKNQRDLDKKAAIEAKQAAIEAKQAAIREKEYASQGKSDPNDQSRTGSSGRRPGSGSGPTTQDSQSKGDPSAGQTGGYSYDSGGREGFGYGLKEGGRAGYFFGGRVNYKIGGRAGFKNGGLASIL